MKTILIAEDDEYIRMGLRDTLESEGYAVVEAADGRQAMDLFERQAVDFLLLDVMMPEKSGYDVCREIRSKNSRIPIIMLTAKGEEIDKVVGLKLGADDYVTKPFGVHELLARIDAVFRRSRAGKESGGPAPDSRIPFGGGRVDTKCFLLEKNGDRIRLSKREVGLIRFFTQHPGEVLSRDALLNAVWGIRYLGTTRTLDQHVAVLRKKIEDNPADPRVITTVHGVGYRYDPPG